MQDVRSSVTAGQGLPWGVLPGAAIAEPCIRPLSGVWCFGTILEYVIDIIELSPSHNTADYPHLFPFCQEQRGTEGDGNGMGIGP